MGFERILLPEIYVSLLIRQSWKAKEWHMDAGRVNPKKSACSLDVSHFPEKPLIHNKKMRVFFSSWIFPNPLAAHAVSQFRLSFSISFFFLAFLKFQE